VSNLGHYKMVEGFVVYISQLQGLHRARRGPGKERIARPLGEKVTCKTFRAILIFIIK
jgi:hypothetical protein